MATRLPETIGTPAGPSVEGSSPALLSELLVSLEQELREQGVPVDEYLRAGASESEIRAGFSECGLAAPPEPLAWFGWHDGPTESRTSRKVMPMFMGWTLAKVDARYDAGLRRTHPEKFSTEPTRRSKMGTTVLCIEEAS